MITRQMRRNLSLLSLLFVFFAAFPSYASDSEKPYIPQKLNQWKSWVLHDKDKEFCPFNYNDGQSHRCVWPSRLKLFIEPETGAFEQQWLIFADAWVPVPGDIKTWPCSVEIDGKKGKIIKKNSIPHIYLARGEHFVKGAFQWKEIPETIRISNKSILYETALTQLFVKGKKIKSPVIDKSGRLWIQKRTKAWNREEKEEVNIFRLLDDTIPMKVTTCLQIDVSGKGREIRLDNLLLKDSITMNLVSPLPARFDASGKLLLQARPGRWKIIIYSRFNTPTYKLGPVSGKYGEEIWSFKSENHLRMVKISGAKSVEPGRTEIPGEWKEFPAYLIKPKSTIIFKEIKRGDPEPAPDRLQLNRTWWLDFDGKGFTIQDKITGAMSSKWYLALNPPGILGRVSVDGVDQLITTHENGKKSGVELRRGKLDMLADSRFAASTRKLPAVGWDHNFQSVSGSLNLPPGWRLIAAGGIDILPGTWIQRWTLLDLFIVLIISAAMFKIRNTAWGLLALITMVLLYHEPGSPRIVWLHLIASMALIRVLPQGFFKRLILFWNICSIIVLLVISIPFIAHQIQTGIYPQLERPGARAWHGLGKSITSHTLENEVGQVIREGKRKSYPRTSSLLLSKAAQYREQAVFSQDPDAMIQTGPGLPGWKWNCLKMNWNGPVDKSQEINLWLLSPFLNLVLSFLRVIFLALLIVGVINFKYWRRAFNKKTAKAAAGSALAVIPAMLILLVSISEVKAENSSFPPSYILDQLQERLLEKPDCLPECADCLRMDLKATPDTLRILLEIHAACKTSVPLPGTSKSWAPENILIDNKPAKGILKSSGNGVIWALIPEGIHTLVLQGSIAENDSIQIPFPLKPHMANVSSKGWDIQGIHENMSVDSNIQLTRLKKEGEKSFKKQIAFTPFLHVERVLGLGLTWSVFTKVKRLTPPGIPVVVSIPLLEGESVTTAGVHVKEGRALINMGAEIKETAWKSKLEMTKKIRLKAPESVLWTETWVLDASPVWHCSLSGIPVIFHQDKNENWQPEWKPWPKEEVVIDISKPKPVPGSTITIDKAELVLTPGKRFDELRLTLNIRSSRGGQHQILLPSGARLQAVKINNKSQPIGQEKGKVVVPLQPGTQKIYIEWHSLTDSSILTKSPEITIGKQAVNARVTFNMPRNQWILWTAGPQLGPAVLFWGYLIVVFIFAAGLGKVPLTPLKSTTWLLLGIGLTQVSSLTAVMIAGWLIALGLRKKYMPDKGWFLHNIIQAALLLWTFAALSGMYQAIEKGLLGIPDMQISGNGSNNFHLYWFQDKIASIMPQPMVFSIPLFVYHLIMLAWAIWLAFSLIRWLKWGWECWSQGKIWIKPVLKRKKKNGEEN